MNSIAEQDAGKMEEAEMAPSTELSGEIGCPHYPMMPSWFGAALICQRTSFGAPA